MKRFLMVLLLFPGLACSTAKTSSVAQGSSDDAEYVVRQLEEKRFQAMIARDTSTLEVLLGDELTYAHSTGKLESKSQFLKTVSGGAIEYLSLSPSETTVRVYDRMVVVHGLAAVSIKSDGAVLTMTVRYTDAWVNRDGRWQMILWQSTRVP